MQFRAVHSGMVRLNKAPDFAVGRAIMCNQSRQRINPRPVYFVPSDASEYGRRPYSYDIHKYLYIYIYIYIRLLGAERLPEEINVGTRNAVTYT